MKNTTEPYYTLPWCMVSYAHILCHLSVEQQCVNASSHLFSQLSWCASERNEDYAFTVRREPLLGSILTNGCKHKCRAQLNIVFLHLILTTTVNATFLRCSAGNEEGERVLLQTCQTMNKGSVYWVMYWRLHCKLLASFSVGHFRGPKQVVVLAVESQLCRSANGTEKLQICFLLFCFFRLHCVFLFYSIAVFQYEQRTSHKHLIA